MPFQIRSIGIGHHVRGRLDRTHHLREPLPGGVDRRIAAQVEREQQHGGEQQREDDPLAPDGVDGHGVVNVVDAEASVLAAQRHEAAHGVDVLERST